MRYLLVGFGNIGRKRKQLLGERCVATVDPYNSSADFANAADCPLDRYEAAILSVPNPNKLELLGYFLNQGKHVLIDKPLLLPDRATGERLAQLAQQHGASWCTSYNHRHEPNIVSLKQALDRGVLGELYHGRFFYGNGTVQNVVGSWRDQGLGVLEDLGTHLLDLSDYLLGYGGSDFEVVTVESHEARSPDHCVLTSADRRVILEASFLCWKNTFSIDLFGERGSLHVYGLEKWGPASLTQRNRVFPSGVPIETVESTPGWTDVTWQRDLDHFERVVALGATSVESDWWISRTLHGLTRP